MGDEPAADSSQSPTLTKGSALGAIMGTASYMSPEQARGNDLDTRTDVWAFGCCLYEALTGNKPFEGDNVTDVLAAVVRAEPDWTKLNHRTSSVIRQCLEKIRRERYQHIGDVRIALERGLAEPEPSTHTDRGRGRWKTSGVAVAVLVTAVVVALLSHFLGASLDTPARVRRATISFPDGQFQRRLLYAPFALSPDGTLLAYAAEDENGSALFVRSLDSFETRRLDGTEEADKPFFSPNGEWVGFFAAGKLRKVLVERGVVQTVASAPYGFGGVGAKTTRSCSIRGIIRDFFACRPMAARSRD